MTPEYFQTFARYNRWMNTKVYSAASLLTDEERKRDRGAFFKSIHATLNHLLVADNIWIGRFTGAELQEDWIGRGAIRALDQELHADFVAMREARTNLDREIEQWTKELTSERLAGTFHFRRLGKVSEASLAWSVAHMFNHQTHHRGQVTTLLTQAGRDVGATDLIVMLREEAAKS